MFKFSQLAREHSVYYTSDTLYWTVLILSFLYNLVASVAYHELKIKITLYGIIFSLLFLASASKLRIFQTYKTFDPGTYSYTIVLFQIWKKIEYLIALSFTFIFSSFLYSFFEITQLKSTKPSDYFIRSNYFIFILFFIVIFTRYFGFKGLKKLIKRIVNLFVSIIALIVTLLLIAAVINSNVM